MAFFMFSVEREEVSPRGYGTTLAVKCIDRVGVSIGARWLGD